MTQILPEPEPHLKRQSRRTRFLRVNNLEKYQHYKKRSPPWVKMYREILVDYDLISLPVHLRFAHLGLLILASETGNNIPNDAQYIGSRLGIPFTLDDLTILIKKGFLLATCKQKASNALASCHSQTESEKRRDREEKMRGCVSPVDNSERRTGVLKDRIATDLKPVGNLSEFFKQKAMEAEA